MPFVDRSSEADKRGGAADALAYDVITRLAKLRSMFVIAQGTTFALRDRAIGPEEAGRMLNVDYVVSGSVRRNGRKFTVSADLIETRTARIVWAEVFDEKIDDALDVLDAIGNRIVASVAHEIEMVERNRAILKPPNSLDAWEAHHRGLWHMYRFNKVDNERARQYFSQAVDLDPTFARAYAGLSFAHFQNAFLGWKKPKTEIDRAFEAAGKSLMVDDRDPAAHWAMGRALWLRGGQDQAVIELERAVDLSPNYATAHYSLAFVHSQSGDPHAAIAFSDHSRQLSPFDPLLFAHARITRHEPRAARAIRGSRRVGHQGRRSSQRPPPHHGHRRLHARARGAPRGCQHLQGEDPRARSRLRDGGFPGGVPFFARCCGGVQAGRPAHRYQVARSPSCLRPEYGLPGSLPAMPQLTTLPLL